MCFRLWSSIATQPEISWPKVSGVGPRWVRPILTDIPEGHCFSLSVAQRLQRRDHFFPQGNQRDAWRWGIHHLSFGSFHIVIGMNFSRHPRSPPSSPGAAGSTSFIFILLWVRAGLPDSQGNSCACFPASTSSAAATIAPAFPPSTVRDPGCLRRRPLGQRQAYIAPGHFSVEMRKCSSERWVWAPQSLSAGTSMAPIESFHCDALSLLSPWMKSAS